MNKRKLLILGAGGHGRVVAESAALMGCWEPILFLDDHPISSVINGIPVAGAIAALPAMYEETAHAIIGIGDSAVRQVLMNDALAAGYALATIIHPGAIISRHALISEGSVVMAGAVVNTGASIGRGVILNTCCSVDHDCIIADGVHISPGAHLGGTVTVGEHSWICTGASIGHGITIGKFCIIAAGAAVVRDVPDHSLVAGVPAVWKKGLQP